MSNQTSFIVNYQFLGQNQSDSIEIDTYTTVKEFQAAIQEEIVVYKILAELPFSNDIPFSDIYVTSGLPFKVLRPSNNQKLFTTPPSSSRLHLIIGCVYPLTCWMLGEKSLFHIWVNYNITLRQLQAKIGSENLIKDAGNLQFYKTEIPIVGGDLLKEANKICDETAIASKLTRGVLYLHTYFTQPPPDGYLHLVIRDDYAFICWKFASGNVKTFTVRQRLSQTTLSLKTEIFNAHQTSLAVKLNQVKLFMISVKLTEMSRHSDAKAPSDVGGITLLQDNQTLGHHFQGPPPEGQVHIMVVGQLTARESEDIPEEIFERSDVEEVMESMGLEYRGRLLGHRYVAWAIDRETEETYFLKFHPQDKFNEIDILQTCLRVDSPRNPTIPEISFRNLSDGVLMLSPDGGIEVDHYPYLSWELPNIVRALLDGVAFLHENKVVHNDLKPSNILVDETTGRLSIIDFHLSDHMADEVTLVKGFTGTLGWTAPEVGGDRPYNLIQAEVWAVGKVIQALCDKCPESNHREALMEVGVSLMKPDPPMRLPIAKAVQIVDRYVGSLRHS